MSKKRRYEYHEEEEKGSHKEMRRSLLERLDAHGPDKLVDGLRKLTSRVA